MEESLSFLEEDIKKFEDECPEKNYTIQPGKGVVKINQKNTVQNKHKKLIAINHFLKADLLEIIHGNQTLGIEILLQYAVDKLKQEKKDLIY